MKLDTLIAETIAEYGTVTTLYRLSEVLKAEGQDAAAAIVREAMEKISLAHFETTKDAVLDSVNVDEGERQ